MNTVLISPQELDALMKSNSVVVVDTRDEDTYNAEHLPSAINVRKIFTYLTLPENGGLDGMVQSFAETFGALGIAHTDHVVLYEDALNTGYGQSFRGYFLLAYLGVKKISVLNGGLPAWKKAGLPTTDAVVTRPQATFVPQVDSSMMLTTEQMKTALGNDGISILDVRDRDEWIGESSSPYGKDFAPRKGRIPGAVWIEWYKFMEKEGDIPMMVSPEKTMEIAQSAGLQPEKPVYVYCFKGSRASNTLIALKNAGFKDVRNYFPSWNEWSRMPELPIDDRVLS
jgi:thiosulfate/3-mercaptopyruvate sulfurtransferase